MTELFHTSRIAHRLPRAGDVLCIAPRASCLVRSAQHPNPAQNSTKHTTRLDKGFSSALKCLRLFPIHLLAHHNATTGGNTSKTVDAEVTEDEHSQRAEGAGISAERNPSNGPRRAQSKAGTAQATATPSICDAHEQALRARGYVCILLSAREIP